MAVQPKALAITSEPSIAKSLEVDGAKSYDDRDFPWAENSLRAWRGLALYGGIVVGMGLLLWVILQGWLSGNPWSLVGVGMLVVLCGFLPMLNGYTELGLACFFGGITGAFLGGIVATGSSGTNLVVAVGILAAAAVALLTGVAGSVRSYRVLARDE